MGKERYNLRPVWDSCIDIYQSIAKVCEAHGLRYYVAWGTALGAVRHHGFIPWDDDFDIAMPRKDFRAFFDIYKRELPVNLKAEDFHDDKRSYDCYEMFGKVYEKREEVIRRVARETNLNLCQGLFVDIFPIDGHPSPWNRLAYNWWFFRRTVWRCVTGFGAQPTLIKPLIPVVKWFLGLSESKAENAKAFERWLMKWDYDLCVYANDYTLNYKATTRKPIRREVFGMARFVAFEDIMVPVPKDVEYYLESNYGDWKTLPPPEARCPSHQVK